MIKSVLFDMDGTVLDTEAMYKRAWHSAFESCGYDFSKELFDKCIGLPIHSIKELINNFYNDETVFELTFSKAAAWSYNYKKMNGVPVKAGFYELIDFLKESGIKSVIATSTSHDAAVEDLTGSKIIGYFEGIIGGDDVEHGKPAPDPYIKAAKLVNTPIENCIAVEDSINGIRSAVAAGVRCIYVEDVVDISLIAEPLSFKKVTSLDQIIPIIKECNSILV